MTTPNVPELEAFCGSWIVTRRDTGEAVCEFTKDQRWMVERINFDRFQVHTAAQYLGAINGKAQN